MSAGPQPHVPSDLVPRSPTSADLSLGIGAIVSDLAPVSRDDIDREAAFQVRHDRKYIVDAWEIPQILQTVSDRARALDTGGQRQFWYESVYFDTPELLTYRAAATLRPVRFKVRTRTYLDTGDRFLEMKARDRVGRTVKSRTPHGTDPRMLDRPARDFLRGFVTVASHVDRLVPVLTTTYQRITLLLEDQTRTTVDTELRASDGHRSLHLAGKAIVETKGRERQGDMDRVLRDLGHRREPISKYSTDLAALRPELPANHWRRTLRRHYPASVFEVPLEGRLS